jgi:hypothetical protein
MLGDKRGRSGSMKSEEVGNRMGDERGRSGSRKSGKKKEAGEREEEEEGNDSKWVSTGR